MARYITTWVDYKLPQGQEFSVAVCGYCGKVRHMTFGEDPIRRMFVKFEDIENNICQTNEHCLALDCPLNHTQLEHLAHMLDMPADEPTDERGFEIWGTDSTVEALVKFAKKISDELLEEMKKNKPLEGKG
jgi:hypothetical protein